MSKYEFHYFKQSGNPEINAAMVGISSESWECAEDKWTKVKASEIMRQNQFDVLPVRLNNGMYVEYYTTTNWAKYTIDNIVLKQIKDAPKLYYLTQIKDVIKQFYHKKIKYFFLSNHDETFGLITIGNLNCKQVYLYLYSEINSLEKNLALIIKKHLSTESILERLNQIAIEKKSRTCFDTVKRFKRDNEKGFDANIEEYLYLSDVFHLISHEGIFSDLGYKTRELFEDRKTNILDVRNIVSHPNKSLIKDASSIEQLYNALEKIEELQDRMEEIK